MIRFKESKVAKPPAGEGVFKAGLPLVSAAWTGDPVRRKRKKPPAIANVHLVPRFLNTIPPFPS
jgi:hypothetical protein